MDGGGTDVLFTFSYETLNDAAQRGFGRPPDRLLNALRSAPEVDKLVVANPFRSQLSRVRRRRITRSLAGVEAVVQPYRLARDDATDVATVERSYRRYEDVVRRACRRDGVTDPAVVTFHPLIAGFCSFDWARSVTFYARDDWTSFPPRAPWHDVYRAGFEKFRARRHRVAAVSRVLLDRLEPTGESLVVPNGVDPEEWLRAAPAPMWLTEIPRPRLLYTGTLDDRLDVDVVGDIARSDPSFSVVLVGPQPQPHLLDPIRGLPNVTVYGPVPRDEIVAITQHCDVGLLPHVKSKLTEAMSPLKVYEYAAGGLPVIATDLPPVRDIGIDIELLPVGPTADWRSRITSALDRGRSDEETRRAFVVGNSWESRHRLVLRLMLEPSRSER